MHAHPSLPSAHCNVLSERAVFYAEADREEEGWVIRSGIVCFLRSAAIPDGTRI
jgi:hypothetical protein